MIKSILRHLLSISTATALVVLLVPFTLLPARAQTRAKPALQRNDDLWTAPVNLSRSGAAKDPVVLASPTGTVQVFWWDRFDGITTSVFQPEADAWSISVVAPLIVGSGERARPIESMPQILSAGETVFALWLGSPDEETDLRPLLLSRLRLGSSLWTDPSVIAESATTWTMSSGQDGTVHLVYTRVAHTEEFPAGIYYKRSFDEGATWSSPELLTASRYVRGFDPQAIHLTSAVASTEEDEPNTVYVAWDDPRLSTPFYVWSDDGGESWAEPAGIDIPGIAPRHPRLAAVDQHVHLIWENSDMVSGCELHYQTVDADTLSAPTRMLGTLRTCPTSLEASQTRTGATILTAGGAAGTFTLAVWDEDESGSEGYSQAKILNFAFDDPETQRRVKLDQLDAAAPRTGIVTVAGHGPNDDIWVLQGRERASDFAFAPPSPWSEPEMVAETSTEAEPPVAAVDIDNQLHLIWADGNRLLYAQLKDDRWTAPSAVGRMAGGVADPALLSLADRLHLVWSGGSSGAVYYSQAYTQDAYAAGAWLEPTLISPPGLTGSAPTMIVDDNGALHVVFAVPLNEGRGIYYTRSSDGGLTWDEPVVVFDANEAGWPMADHPTLAADAVGNLHVAFVQGSVDGPFSPEAIRYVRSTDGGESWSAPQLIVEDTADYPRLAAAAGGELYVLWHTFHEVEPVRRSTVNERISTDYGETWGYQQAVPGFQDLLGTATLVRGVSLEGDAALTLVGLAQTTDGDSVVQVGVMPGSRWEILDEALAPFYKAQRSAVAALNPTARLMHVIYGAEVPDEDAPSDSSTLSLFHSARTIDVTEGAAAAPVPAQPTPTPTPGPSPTPTATPRPTVNAAAPAQEAPAIEAGPLTLPMTAIWGLAGTIVLVAGVVLIAGRRR